jgi:hypothetical protein
MITGVKFENVQEVVKVRYRNEERLFRSHITALISSPSLDYPSILKLYREKDQRTKPEYITTLTAPAKLLNRGSDAFSPFSNLQYPKITLNLAVSRTCNVVQIGWVVTQHSKYR